MKTTAQLASSIERFQTSFWERRAAKRPPVGVTADAAWLPIKYLRGALPTGEMRPADLDRACVATDYQHCFACRAVQTDDFMPFSAAWRAVPWLEAICGCGVRCSAGSLGAAPCMDSVAALDAAAIPARPEWLDALRRDTAYVVETAPQDCWVSPSILRGASDVLGAMRGLDNFFVDLAEDPQALARAIPRINDMQAVTLAEHFAVVRPKMGGYGHIFGHWAPGPTTVLQQDALGMTSPRVYGNLFAEGDAELVRRLGPYTFFHLHSTGYRFYKRALEIPGLAGLEVTVEANGPPLEAMLPDLRAILERSRLILMLDGWFEQLPAALRQLPAEGLYLVLPDRAVPDEAAFRAFLSANWGPGAA